ncbi:MAG TPA: DUF6152 family protein [Bryobacteraceae bacterium]|nr:DUF6152 family protein [Bryobacteraceae bacterium]
MRHRILTVLAVSIAAGSLWAHHSTSAVFDMNKKIQVTGTLTKVDWINPHISIFVDAKGEKGIDAWHFEGSPPAWFRRVGVNKNDIAKATGQMITVDGVKAKDGSLYGYLQKITFPDGSTLETVSAGQIPER